MNAVGAGMVSFWLGLFFLLILGFGYSYFWSASAIIYLLMRKKVDDQEMDEVYLEEEADNYGGPLTAPAAPAPTATAPARPTAPLTMVESPTLRAAAPVTRASAPGGAGRCRAHRSRRRCRRRQSHRWPRCPTSRSRSRRPPPSCRCRRRQSLPRSRPTDSPDPV